MAALWQLRARMAARGRTVADTPGAARDARPGRGRGGQLGLAPLQHGRGWEGQGQGWETPGGAGSAGYGEREETDEYENDSWLVDGELAG